MVGISPGASFTPVTDASWIFEVPTELSASFVLSTADALIVGLGYVPVRSPPAEPPGGKLPGITPGASFAEVIDPSAIFVVVIALFAIAGFGRQFSLSRN